MNIIDNDLNKLLAKPNETIRVHTDYVKKQCSKLYDLGYISKEIYTLLNLACEYHDYGKLNLEFQNRIKKKTRFDSQKEIPHNILSTFFIPTNFESDLDYYLVFYAILNHHHHSDNFQIFKDEKDLAMNLLSKYNLRKIKTRFITNLEKENKANASQASLLLGLLNKCDFSASGHFEVEYENNFLLKSLDSLNFNSWNSLQNFMIENRDENLIAVANTGMGKTEAGLLWIGDTKGFFILPLKTAINSIYNRTYNMIKKYTKNHNIYRTLETMIALNHSESLDFILSNNDSLEFNEANMYVNEGKNNLSIPLSITTLDQLFTFVFLYPGYEIKLATLSYSKLVIDEIQAYSPDLIAYIVVGLKKIIEVGGKFAILTATLPPYIRTYLENELGHIKYKTFLEGKDRHNISVVPNKIDSSFIAKHYLKNGGKTLIVCNTVKIAQKVFDELLELGITHLELFHAKFIKKDRLKKESDILEFGKTSVNGDKIWISTSLVEASLDIDFDYLFTELNDLSGLFQRLGRVNRKGIKNIEKINAYIFTDIDSSLFIKGKKGFIDKDIFLLSKEALNEVDGILSEVKKYELIEKYLTFENIKNSSFHFEFKKTKEYMGSVWSGLFSKKEVLKIFRNIISYKIIPVSIYEENKSFIVEQVNKYNSALTFEEREQAKKEINNFTLSVGIYEKSLSSYGTIILNKEEILISEGDYSYSRGFEKNKGTPIELENVDNFL